MKNRNSIYSDCNPKLVQIFESAGHPAKVMCVALDYAKSDHTALFCNGLGDMIQSSFSFENNLAGTKFLLEKVRACAKQRKIKPEHVFFGGEDCPSFAENFVRQLRHEKFLVIRVNAGEAKRQRDNNQASNDSLDLLGIARCCLKRHGSTVEDLPQAYASLRIVNRDRDKVVRLRTITSNRIHTYVDRLLPGFLDQAKSGLAPFCKASLDLMAEGLSHQKINHRSQSALSQWLGHRQVEEPGEVARKLKKLAKSVPGAAPQQTLLLQNTLSRQIELYRCLDKNIESMNREMAYWLARTPGALLTSINGIGITLAAGWIAELGPPKQWRCADRLCSYGGVVPRSKQTGGPGQEPVTGKVGQRANKRFKNTLLQSVLKVRQHGSPEWLQTIDRLHSQGSHVDNAIAKRLVRVCKFLVTTGTLYRPKALMAAVTPKATLSDYYQSLWKKLLPKWDQKADLAEVFSPKNPLGEWRQMAREIYALDLRLPRQQGQPHASVSTP